MEEEVDFKGQCMCGSVQFMQEDGKTFCMECQTELEAAKEIVYEAVDYGPETGDLTQRTRVLTTTVKQQTATAKAQELPTSWECYNQILCDLVDEVEEVEESIFGTIHPQFKLTVLQLWAAYLRYHGKAFFSKESAEYPQFNPQYHITDAEIVYKIKRPQRPYAKRKPKKTTIARARKRNIRTIKKQANQLALRQQKALANGKPTDTTKPKIPFQFTPHAKKCLLKLMSEEHLKEHEENPLLMCHKFIWRYQSKKPEEITKYKLYALLFMALNHVESDIKLADLIRFLREGHVTLQIATTVSNNPRYNLLFNSRIQKGNTSIPRHSRLLEMSIELAKQIGYQFKENDLSELYKRYLQDLCLPPEIGGLIDVMLEALPSNIEECRKRKNYEVRAMAFILFTLKLLFGLDDSREYLISSSVREINQKISELNANNPDGVQQKQVFVWTDWVEYIEMRDIILMQLHCPTAMKQFAHGDGMTGMYLEHLTKTEEKTTDVKSTFKPYAKLITRVRDHFQATYDLNPKSNDKLAFYPSLTPKRSYMEEVRYSGQLDIFVPPFMDCAHDERDIEPFLKPSKLRSFFRQNNIKLTVNKLECVAGLDVTQTFSDFPHHQHGKYYGYDFDITTEEWLKQLNDKNECKKKPKDNTRRFVELRLDAIRRYKRPDKEDLSGSSKDSRANMFKCDSEEEDEEDDIQSTETLEFSISNSDYWLLFDRNIVTKHEFTDFRKLLSKTFQWLLKQGADLIESQESDLYIELILIEYYFAKNVVPSDKPFNKMLKHYRHSLDLLSSE